MSDGPCSSHLHRVIVLGKRLDTPFMYALRRWGYLRYGSSRLTKKITKKGRNIIRKPGKKKHFSQVYFIFCNG